MRGHPEPAIPLPGRQAIGILLDTIDGGQRLRWTAMRTFTVVPEKSSIIVEAKSSVGPIAFEGLGCRGQFQIQVDDHHIGIDQGAIGELEVDLTRLTSGNAAYDAELQRRIDTRKHPTAHVTLTDIREIEAGRFWAEADLSFHGVTRAISGTIEAQFQDDHVEIRGIEGIDIRDFGIPTPSVLMLKIYPEVRVHLFVSGTPAG